MNNTLRSEGRHFCVSAGPAGLGSRSQMLVFLSIASWWVSYKLNVSERDIMDCAKEIEDNQWM